MHVAVVIVGFRNPGDIDACLGSLEASSHRDFEVIICENGGREAHAALETVLRRDRPFPV
jgi:N-acetylglucosaminyl-diphospho-decaprenol L-rhamnosyltransferase